MIYLTLIILICITIYAYFRYKYLLCPAFIHNIMWIVSLIWLSFIKEKEYLTLSACILIIFGSIFFQIGHKFYITLGKKTEKRCVKNYKIIPNITNIWILVSICFVLFFINYNRYFKSIIKTRGLYWYNAIAGIKTDVGIVDSDYIGSAIQYIFIALLILYLDTKSAERKLLKFPLLIMFFMNICIVVFVATRNRMLFFVLPMLIAFLLCKEKNNKDILKYVLLLATAFIAYFISVGIGKYFYNYSSGFALDTFLVEFGSYLCTGVINLGYSIEHFQWTLNGKNTFSFFSAVYGKITGNSYTIVSTVTDIPLIFGRFKSNVFTFYDLYLRDFGVIYSLFMQFFVGVLHGNLYFRINKKNMMVRYLFCMLIYPLVMQFFLDQYVSLTSLWIQVILAGFLIYKTNLFFQFKYEDDCN